MTHKYLFANNWFFWAIYSDRFFHAANILEKTVRKAEKIWEEEMDKLNLEPGVWQIGESTIREQKAERDKSCHHIYPYLYYHSLELLFKSLICLYFPSEKLKNQHSLKNLFYRIKRYFEPLPFDLKELDKMLLQLDGMYWSFRYPDPNAKNEQDFENSTQHLTIERENIPYPTNNIGLIFDQNKEMFMQLREHILKHENFKKVLPNQNSSNITS